MNPIRTRCRFRHRVIAQLEVRVQVLGAKISESTLRSLLPIYEEGAVDEDLLQEGRRNLRDYLQRQGYFDAEVNYTTSEDPAEGPQGSTEVIIYRVELASRHRLVGFGFFGNHYFATTCSAAVCAFSRRLCFARPLQFRTAHQRRRFAYRAVSGQWLPRRPGEAAI